MACCWSKNRRYLGNYLSKVAQVTSCSVDEKWGTLPWQQRCLGVCVDTRSKDERPDHAEKSGQRQPWQVPRLRVLETEEAETGINTGPEVLILLS
jgi:hypothetical protein